MSTPKTVTPVITAKVIVPPAKPLKMATPTEIIAPQIAAKVLAIPSKMPKAGTPTKMVAPEIAAKLMVASSKTAKAGVPTKPAATPIVSAVPALANEAKITGKRVRNSKTAQTAPALALGNTAGLDATAKAGISTGTSVPSDVSVKQFLRNFSRVYAEGDYFALHNLFTQDLSILGAPPQRKTLRSYRQLFETSQSRQIALDHISWLANDDGITVIASYKVQIIAIGQAETESSRGDIRLDLRMENGRLKIIRLQSDDKNG